MLNVFQGKIKVVVDDGAIVERGVELLRFFLDDIEDRKRALDLVEMVTERPELQRRILREFESRSFTGRREVSPSRREVDGNCVRCGRGLSEGYFIDSAGGEVGPFGSTCIQRVEE